MDEVDKRSKPTETPLFKGKFFSFPESSKIIRKLSRKMLTNCQIRQKGKTVDRLRKHWAFVRILEEKKRKRIEKFQLKKFEFISKESLANINGPKVIYERIKKLLGTKTLIPDQLLNESDSNPNEKMEKDPEETFDKCEDLNEEFSKEEATNWDDPVLSGFEDLSEVQMTKEPSKLAIMEESMDEIFCGNGHMKYFRITTGIPAFLGGLKSKRPIASDERAHGFFSHSIGSSFCQNTRSPDQSKGNKTSKGSPGTSSKLGIGEKKALSPFRSSSTQSLSLFFGIKGEAIPLRNSSTQRNQKKSELFVSKGEFFFLKFQRASRIPNEKTQGANSTPQKLHLKTKSHNAESLKSIQQSNTRFPSQRNEGSNEKRPKSQSHSHFLYSSWKSKSEREPLESILEKEQSLRGETINMRKERKQEECVDNRPMKNINGLGDKKWRIPKKKETEVVNEIIKEADHQVKINGEFLKEKLGTTREAKFKGGASEYRFNFSCQATPLKNRKLEEQNKEKVHFEENKVNGNEKNHKRKVEEIQKLKENTKKIQSFRQIHLATNRKREIESKLAALPTQVKTNPVGSGRNQMIIKTKSKEKQNHPQQIRKKF